MKAVKVEWLDICSSTTNWTHIEDIKPSVMKCVSFGIIVMQDDDILCIAQNYDKENDLFSDTMTFPKSIVSNVVELCEI